jgi:hypothetical protein
MASRLDDVVEDNRRLHVLRAAAACDCRVLAASVVEVAARIERAIAWTDIDDSGERMEVALHALVATVGSERAAIDTGDAGGKTSAGRLFAGHDSPGDVWQVEGGRAVARAVGRADRSEQGGGGSDATDGLASAEKIAARRRRSAIGQDDASCAPTGSPKPVARCVANGMLALMVDWPSLQTVLDSAVAMSVSSVFQSVGSMAEPDEAGFHVPGSDGATNTPEPLKGIDRDH